MQVAVRFRPIVMTSLATLPGRLEVLDAEDALTEARSNVLAAIVTYDVAQVALPRALGGVSVPVLLQLMASEGARPGGVTAPRQP